MNEATVKTYVSEWILDAEDLPDGDEGAGVWLLCDWCDGCWRPDAAAEHEDGCPVIEVMDLRQELAKLHGLLVVTANGSAR